jgi:SWI/SNF-related matrix-associated actin-dependent regulator 1 of chromatin subfamily A
MLQPSIHARGARPFIYRGALDDYHSPGAEVVRGGGETRAAVDSAWLVQKVLGEAAHSPPMWPGVPGARERAIYYAKQMGGYDYQLEGAAYLAERDYALLTDQMGIGKTPQALFAAEARLSMASIPSPTTPVVLVIAPALAKRNWQREILKWTGHESSVLSSMTPGEIPQTRYVICNYDILHGAQKKDAAGVVFHDSKLRGWGGVLANQFLIAILDESHLLRGRKSQRTQATRKTLLRTPVVWGLTGTPIPNYIRDLWAQLDLITNGLVGPYWNFTRAYCDGKQAQYGWVDTGSSRLDELGARMTFFCLGRTADSVKLQLPEKRREIYRVDVTMSAPTVHEGHEAMTKSAFVGKALRLTARAKRAAVVQLAVEALEAKQKVIVFLYMREQCDAVAKAIKNAVDCPVMCVHGDLSPDGRDAQAKVFRESSSPTCFVATIDSVTMAISLVGADLMIFGDLVPEPWKLVQAEKRAHRIGGTNRLLVRYVIGTGTLDEAVAETVIDKLATIEQAMGVESDNSEMKVTLGGRPDEDIVDDLFAKLRTMKSVGDGD